MLVSLIGYLFCLALGAWGFYVAGTQLLHGTLVTSLDNLFMTLFAALMGVTAFGYLAWRFIPVLTAGAPSSAGAGTATALYVLPKDPEFVDPHMSKFNKVWVGLLVLTGIEVVLAYFQIGGVMTMLIILLVLSVVKAAMIMSRFMHLHFDHPHLSWLVVAPAVFCIAVMCGYFFQDSFLLLEQLRP